MQGTCKMKACDRGGKVVTKKEEGTCVGARRSRHRAGCIEPCVLQEPGHVLYHFLTGTELGFPLSIPPVFYGFLHRQSLAVSQRQWAAVHVTR